MSWVHPRDFTRALELKPGDPDGLGQIGRYVWRSAIPYPVEFEIGATGDEAVELVVLDEAEEKQDGA